MQVFQKSRPSPAMIVAVIALSFAVVGTAVAGTDGLERKVTKSKVKKIAKKQANKVLNKRESSLNVNSAQDADQLDGQDSTAYATRLWAVVDTAGTLIRGAGATAVNDAGTGKAVVFDRDVTGCGASATLNTDNPNANPPAGEIGTAPRMANANAIFVQARTSTGTVTDAGFVLTVDC